MLNLKKKALSATLVSELMSGKEKISTDEIILNYPNGITLTAVDLIESAGEGQGQKTYPVFTFKEDETKFGNGGVCLTKIIESWLEPDEDGVIPSIKDVNEALKEEEVKIKFTKGKTKNGKNITKVIIVD